MYEILTTLLRITAPIMALTADEAWGYLRAGAGRQKSPSIHLEPWPEDAYEARYDAALEEKWRRLVALREIVLGKLEEKRQAGEIGSSLEARVVLSASDDEMAAFLKGVHGFLRYLFITSQVELGGRPAEGMTPEGTLPVVVQIEKAKGTKCQRCWNYSEAVGADSAHPTLCERCVAAIS